MTPRKNGIGKFCRSHCSCPLCAVREQRTSELQLPFVCRDGAAHIRTAVALCVPWGSSSHQNCSCPLCAAFRQQLTSELQLPFVCRLQAAAHIRTAAALCVPPSGSSSHQNCSYPLCAAFRQQRTSELQLPFVCRLQAAAHIRTAVALCVPPSGSSAHQNCSCPLCAAFRQQRTSELQLPFVCHLQGAAHIRTAVALCVPPSGSSAHHKTYGSLLLTDFFADFLGSLQRNRWTEDLHRAGPLLAMAVRSRVRPVAAVWLLSMWFEQMLVHSLTTCGDVKTATAYNKAVHYALYTSRRVQNTRYNCSRTCSMFRLLQKRPQGDIQCTQAV